MEKWEGAELNKAKEILAFELTKLVHGEEKAIDADKKTKAAFGGGSEEDMPVKEVDKNAPTVMDVMVLAGLTKSKGEARRLIEGGGVSIDDTKVTTANMNLPEEVVAKGEFVLHKGKKVHIKVKLA
jgi:tyrosyl-tRNA synthetase